MKKKIKNDIKKIYIRFNETDKWTKLKNGKDVEITEGGFNLLPKVDHKSLKAQGYKRLKFKTK